MTTEEDISVSLSEDRMTATVRIPAAFPPAQLSAALIVQAARDAGVTSKSFVETLNRQAERLVERFKSNPTDIEDTLLEGEPRKDPINGAIEWMEGFDPTEEGGSDTDEENGGDDTDIDFYNRVAYINVAKGTHIANVIMPAKGVDGKRLDGVVMKARDPQPLAVRFHESTNLTPSGRLVAEIDGVLQLRRNELRISRVLDIAEYVDFNTGNVDFDGSVTVREGVRDKFIVRATEDVTVYGLIEGASILCGGTLVARTGMAAREGGNIITGGDARVGYLNNARGRVKGNLSVQSELVNCEMIVLGELVARGATVLGGHIILAGKGEIGTLGSDAYVETTMSLACAPCDALKLSKLSQFRDDATEELEKIDKELHGLKNRPRLTPSQERKMQDLSFKSFDLRERVNQADQKRLALSRNLAKSRRVDLGIRGTLYPKVILRIGQYTVQIKEETSGPIHITTDKRGTVIYRTAAHDYRPIGSIGSVSVVNSDNQDAA